MKGLLLKDLNTLKGYGKQYGIVFGIMILWAAAMKNASFVAMYSILLGGMLVLSTMSLDEAVNFNRWALTTPVGVRGLIKAKYILLVCTVGAGTALGFVLNAAIGGLFGGVWWEEMESLPMVAALFFIAYSITLPVSFKLGVEKSRYIYIVVLAFSGAFLFGLFRLLASIGALERIETVSYTALNLAFLTVSILALLISYRISVRVVRNKEW